MENGVKAHFLVMEFLLGLMVNSTKVFKIINVGQYLNGLRHGRG
jgi:hypothetical protein